MAVRYLHIPALWSAPKRAFAGTLVIQAIFLGVLFGQAVLEPLWKTKQSRIHYPGKATAEFLSDVWEKETGTELAYVAGDEWTTANVTLHAPSRPSMFLEHNTTLSPWIDLDDVQKKGRDDPLARRKLRTCRPDFGTLSKRQRPGPTHDAVPLLWHLSRPHRSIGSLYRREASPHL